VAGQRCRPVGLALATTLNDCEEPGRHGRPWAAHKLAAAARSARIPEAEIGFLDNRCGMSLPEAERIQARMAVVEEHIRGENRHDLDAVMATFGMDPRYDDEPWEDRRIGRDGVRSYYTELMHALPDLTIAVKHRHTASEAVVVEVAISGTHLGGWRGLPATGRRLEFPLCGIYTFDADDRLVGERIYYDRGLVLRQLGLFHEPSRGLGRVITALSHPVTIARAYLRRLATSVPTHRP
jgi:steroid delta-isomerase-like uncharacterized protein